MELDSREVAMLTGRPLRTVQDWCALGKLPFRRVSGRGLAISPVALVEFLRKLQPAAVTPKVIESQAQKEARGQKEKSELLAMCGKSRGKKSLPPTLSHTSSAPRRG